MKSANQRNNKRNMSRKLILSLSRKDFRVDTFRVGGHGGQNVQKRDTGVRIVHLESGLSAESRVHRTQQANKKEAFRKLADRLIDFYLKTEDKNRYSAGTRVVRTYNEAKDRVTDHETGKQYSFKKTIGKGEISVIIDDRAKEKSRNVQLDK
jgi:peptide chain release factor 1